VCASCHKFIDDVGFGFERYDGVGDYRPMEAGRPVDASGVLLGLEAWTPNHREVRRAVQLGALLAGSPNAQACMARQLFRYARGGESGDRGRLRHQAPADRLRPVGPEIRQLLLEVIKQKSFASRN
jgi:hypothetical protein